MQRGRKLTATESDIVSTKDGASDLNTATNLHVITDLWGNTTTVGKTTQIRIVKASLEETIHTVEPL